MASNDLLRGLLRDVSRTFYLTLRIVPRSVRGQIGTAYLLARTTDTIADTELVPLDDRLAMLHSLRGRILGHSKEPLNFSVIAHHQGSPAERALLIRCESTLDLLHSLSVPDQKLIREVLSGITSGQELDLWRFNRATPENIVALQSEDELDDYTYRVAGCVGEFWTRMCRAHVFPKADLDDAFLLTNGVRFGKGLQLVNILRDLPADLAKGRCYLPKQKLAEIELVPADLLKSATETKLRPLYDGYLALAESHLVAGWEYTNTLPWRCIRARLACAWPILIGFETVKRLRQREVLDSKTPIKISRTEVRQIIQRTLINYPVPSAWRQLGRSRPSEPAKAVASAEVLS